MVHGVAISDFDTATVVGRTGTRTCYPAFGVLSASICFRALPAQLYIASVDSYPVIQAIFSLHKRAFHLMARSILAHHTTSIIKLQKDIEMFNPKLRLATLPRWVLFKASRIGKMHGLVMLSFDNKVDISWGANVWVIARVSMRVRPGLIICER
jgi:hypothetical protein